MFRMFIFLPLKYIYHFSWISVNKMPHRGKIVPSSLTEAEKEKFYLS